MSKWREVQVPTHPLKDGRWVATVAHIRNNATGEIRKHPDNAIIETGESEPSDYMWSEGNYACDCNRGLFFGYAVGLKYEEIPHACGDGAFSVNVENPETGEIFYREFDE